MLKKGGYTDEKPQGIAVIVAESATFTYKVGDLDGYRVDFYRNGVYMDLWIDNLGSEEAAKAAGRAGILLLAMNHG